MAMRKIITSLAMLIPGIGILAQEVVLTHTAHAFSAERVNEMWLSDYVDPGEGGADRVWDLSGMQNKQAFQGVTGSSFGTDTENDFPESNIVFKELGNNYFFSLDERFMKGYGMISGSGNTVIHYDRPYVKMEYPFAYGDRIARDYSGKIRISSVEYPVEGTYEVEADGYGRLILPDGVQHAHTLRVKTTQSYTMHYDLPSQVEIVTYRWYSDRERYPLAVLLTTTTTTGDNTTLSHKAAYKDASQLERQSEMLSGPDQAEVTIYPNPAEEHLIIDYSVDVETDVIIELYDNSGKKVSTLVNRRMEPGIYTYLYHMEGLSLSKGTYFIRSVVGTRTATNSFVKL